MKRLLMLLVLIVFVVALKAEAASGPDLAPYKPPGWSAPLICSMDPGATSPDYTLKKGKPVYVKVAVKNVGDERSPLGDYAIMVDGNVVRSPDAYVYLDPGEYYIYPTQEFTFNSTGTHTVTGMVDYDENVDEFNEENNDFSANYKWVKPGPDLIPYKPPGWSSPCVCSTEPGDVTGGDDLRVGETTYVNFAVKNVGNETADGISLAIFVDGVQVAGYFDLSEDLAAYGSYLTFDASFTINSPGVHTVRYEVDYYNYVDEINEGNNTFTAVYECVESGPDLVPYKPSGWSVPLICSMDPDATSPDYTLKKGEPVYVKVAVKNIGNEGTNLADYAIMVDGEVVRLPHAYVHLDPNETYIYTTQQFTFNSTGTHTVTGMVDYNEYIDELDEDNNDFSANYQWVELGPDLILYQPPGWSSPLVCSAVEGDTIGDETLPIGFPIYVNSAVKNVGNERSPIGRYLIKMDGSAVANIDVYENLDPGEYYVFPVRQFTVNTPGTHTITGVVDGNEDVDEINEDNNDFSVDHYWPPGPDLVPYIPDGWGAPIVCSPVPGDTTADDTLATDIVTNVSFAVANFGNETASGISLAIFVDGVQVAEILELSEELESGSYAVFDAVFTINSPGMHTVTYEVDYYDYVDEGSESNNSFSADYYWSSGPDLVPYAPPGWSAPLVCSTEEGDTLGGNSLVIGIPTYVMLAVKNVGNERSPLGDYAIMVDGEVVRTTDAYVYLDPGEYYVFPVQQFTFNAMSTHTITGVIDYDENVDEINKGNNDFSIDYGWIAGMDLVPYVPDGWDYAVVASSVPGTHTHDLPPLFGETPTYIDWAVKNDGNLDVPSADSFYVALYSEEGFLNGWWFGGLDVGDSVYVEDWEYLFSSGQHTLTLFVDSTDNIKEGILEDNNRYSKDYFWNEPDWGGGGDWYADSAEYIIITCDSLTGAFEPLARWKTKKGVYAKVFTVEDICANFSGDHTGDNASKIRNFIYEARESGAIYVLLGGQCDFEHGEEIVPRRDVERVHYGYENDTIPCDLYYSDLNRNWDMDFDGVYGECLDKVYNDRVDLYADIFVGRAPVKNTQQVENFISKVITYEKSPDTAYIEKIYLPQGNLFSGNSGRGINDSIAVEVPAGWQVSKQYEDFPPYISQQMVNDSMNSGFNLQHWVGHGSWQGVHYDCEEWPCEPYYFTTDPPNNTNDSTKASIISSIACFAGAVHLEDDVEYDYDCLAERIVNENKHAGVATVMNTWYGLGSDDFEGALGPSGKLSVEFHRELFNSSEYRLGELVSAAKNAYAHIIGNTILYSWTLFGDPEMPVWTDVPVEMEVTYDEIINVETTIVDINVKEKNSSVPVENAYVCLWTENEVYERGYTNANGDLSLTVTPTTAGLMSVTITKENMLPYEGEIVVGNQNCIETGRVSVAQTDKYQWHTVEFSHNYTDPIVVMGPPSYEDTDPTTVRVKDIDSNGFKFQLDEWNYLDGSHNTETISYFVMEAGVHLIGDVTWEAGKVENVNHDYTLKEFDCSFGGDQTLLTQVVTYNGSAAVCTRIDSLEESSFKVKLQEEEAADGEHPYETVHYIAVSPGTGQIDGKDFISSETPKSVTHEWYTINFGQSLDSPLILANMSTEDGNNTSVLRYRNLSSSSVQVKVEEEQSKDDEVRHTRTEVVGYLVISDMEPEPSSFETTEDKEIYENYIKLSFPIITGNIILNVSSNYDRKASVELIDIVGRVVEKKSLNLKRGRENVNLGRFVSGVYFLRIRADEDNETEVRKVTVLR